MELIFTFIYSPVSRDFLMHSEDKEAILLKQNCQQIQKKVFPYTFMQMFSAH